MTILFVGNSPNELGGATTPNTTTNARDPAFTAIGSKVEGTNYTFSDAALGFNLQFPNPVTDLWIHFVTNWNAVSSNSNTDGYWLRLFLDSNLLATYDVLNGSTWTLVAGATSVPATFHGANTDVTYDFHITSTGTSMTWDVYVNGALTTTLTWDTTSGLPNRITFDHFDMNTGGENPNPKIMYYSEVIITDGESTLGWRLATLPPAAQGFHTGWDGDYTGVQSLGDGSAIAASAIDQKESWTLSAYGGPVSPAGIRAVVNTYIASVGSTGPQTVIPLTRIAGVDYETAALVTDGTPRSVVLDDNPATSSPWLVADLSSLEIGVKSST